MNEDILKYRARLNETIGQLALGKHPEQLYDPIKYTLDLGGKRMRPVLTILSYLTVDHNWESILKPALAVELFHNFTLLHDDIMDEAPLRRGQSTVHKKWDKNIAILSGDALMVLAYDLLLEADYPDIKYLVKLFNQCALQVCEGQQLDMNFEKSEEVSEENYLEMIRLKTAVLLGFSLEMGALLGGMSKSDAQKMRAFGHHIGIGFQLKDDILDAFGNAEKTGKQLGGDILANKKTFLTIKAKELADENQKYQLNKWLGQSAGDPEEKVRAFLDIYKKHNLRQLAEAKMNESFELGFKQLESLNLQPSAIKPLKAFTQFLINRDH